MEQINMSRQPPESSQGFTLIEIAIVLLIIGLALGMVLSVSSSMTDSQKRQTVRTQLNTLDTALANFVAKNKRLPCPADGAIASGTLNAGVEMPVVPTGLCSPVNQIHGVVPWITLGLTESDGSDPWFGRFTYRVQPALASSLTPLMDMSNCDPAGIGLAGAGGICLTPCAGTACTSPTNFLASKGLDVWNGDPDPASAAGWATRVNNPALGTGAAYVIISHGPSGGRAYNSSGLLQPGSIAAGPNEMPNLNNQAIAIPSALATTYRDAQLNDNATGTVFVPVLVWGRHFDDYLSHPTIMSVLNRANLGPRAH